MIVVTGATGNVGRALVDTLVTTGEEVTAVSRQPAQMPRGVEHYPADLAEPSSLETAFDGASALFLLVAGDDPRAVLEAAAAGGVQRLVLLSSQGAGTRPEVYRHPRAFEDAVQQSGLEWTVLRPGGFHTNAFAWAESVRSERSVAAPFGDVGLPTIDPADIAEVAAAVLRTGGHSSRTYELTGPERTTPRERAWAIAQAVGEPVEFVEQTRAEARAQMLQFMPESVVNGTLAILGDPLPVEQAVSDAVEGILGRRPRTFTEWAKAAAPAFT